MIKPTYRLASQGPPYREDMESDMRLSELMRNPFGKKPPLGEQATVAGLSPLLRRVLALDDERNDVVSSVASGKSGFLK